MTALLELKQKIKGFYAQYEVYLMPLLKFVLALVYFVWINSNMGYMSVLNDIFVVLILALICCILPSGVTIFTGFVLMVGHCYAIGLEAAGFMLVLILFLLIMVLRFSAGRNIVLVFTPLAFAFDLPVLLPIGCGLLSNAVSALPAGCGVIIYYFIRMLHGQAGQLESGDLDIMGKLKLMADGMVQNGEMWLTLIAVIAVILIVNLIRTRSFDYAWRIAIIVGGVVYAVIMLGGSFYFGTTVDIAQLIIFTVLAVLICLVLEFFVFGGDYSRTERLEYEDDEYYYYVKAVPKAVVSTSDRNIKKINAKPSKEERKKEKKKDKNKENTTEENKDIETAPEAAPEGTPLFQSDDTNGAAEQLEEALAEDVSIVEKPSVDDVDFEKKLEESLKDL